MPTYKVGYPFLFIDAPSKEAARQAYRQFLKAWWNVNDCGIKATEVDDAPSYVVDAVGYEIAGGTPCLS